MTKIKKTKKLIKQLKPYWKQLRELERIFRREVFDIEREMESVLGIKGIEFFMCDNEYTGIGNLNRTMQLILGSEIEE